MIIRHGSRRKFTTVDRDAINDDGLSFRARGVLVWLLDKPDNWDVRSNAIADAGAEGRDAIRSALAELEAHGYLVRQRRQTCDGFWITETWIYEYPGDAPLLTEDEIPPGPDSQASDTRTSDSQALTTSLLKTNTEAKKKRKKPATELPDDWRPSSATKEWVYREYPDHTSVAILEAFKDHARANDRRQVDWDAAFKNWVRNEAKWAKGTGNPNREAARTYLGGAG